MTSPCCAVHLAEIQRLDGELAKAREDVERLQADSVEFRGCVCRHVTPCNERCTCVDPFSSSGCERCCSYGSFAQRQARAERLVAEQSALRAERDALAEDLRVSAAYHDDVCIAKERKLRAQLAAASLAAETNARWQAEAAQRETDALNERNAARVECERLRKGLREMRISVRGNTWHPADATTASAVTSAIDALIGKVEP